MSGGGIAYNLRPNKYVERQLFIELVTALYANVPRRKLVYVSLGGPQLEDQKLIHYQLGIENLISLELDPFVYERQLFNLRPYIECKNESTGDFIKSFDKSFRGKSLVIWLDYADSNERRVQIEEYEGLISQLGRGDTVKITMNANPDTLGGAMKGETSEQMRERRLVNLTRVLGDYLPEDLTPDEMQGKRLVPVLCKAIKKAAQTAAERMSSLETVPVAIFSYNDGQHQLVTVTVHITPSAQVGRLHKRLNNAKWEFFPSGWEDISYIDIPNLTPKERLFIEGLLFRKDTDTSVGLHENLPFRFHKDERVSIELLEQFTKYYRRYPSYVLVSL